MSLEGSRIDRGEGAESGTSLREFIKDTTTSKACLVEPSER